MNTCRAEIEGPSPSSLLRHIPVWAQAEPPKCASFHKPIKGSRDSSGHCGKLSVQGGSSVLMKGSLETCCVNVHSSSLVQCEKAKCPADTSRPGKCRPVDSFLLLSLTFYVTLIIYSGEKNRLRPFTTAHWRSPPLPPNAKVPPVW